METHEIVIDLQGVERTYTTRNGAVHALSGVSFQVRRGEFIALMGPSGSGKTTLLNLIGGLDRPTRGAVMVEGQRIDTLRGRALVDQRRRMGFIFQSFSLSPTASAYENVELALRLTRCIPRHDWHTHIHRCLAAVGLRGWADHRPYELSGGQQQRVAIARALATRPHIILADEPTGDLDTATGSHVLGLLRALTLTQGVTIVMATHDLNIAQFTSSVFQLRDGYITV